MSLHKKYGFTLAEILITLGIIGVIAVCTIPNVIQNTQEKVAVTALRKAYSALSQAFTFAVQENGTPENWDLGNNGALNILNNLAPYLKIKKNCQNGTGCWITGSTYLNGTPDEESWVSIPIQRRNLKMVVLLAL